MSKISIRLTDDNERLIIDEMTRSKRNKTAVINDAVKRALASPIEQKPEQRPPDQLVAEAVFDAKFSAVVKRLEALEDSTAYLMDEIHDQFKFFGYVLFHFVAAGYDKSQAQNIFQAATESYKNGGADIAKKEVGEDAVLPKHDSGRRG